MDVLSTILACSMYFDDALVRAVIQTNSSGVQYFVGDTRSLVSYDYPTSIENAKGCVQKVLEKDGRPAVGLMAVPLDWAATFGRKPDDLWDACTNVAIGTAMLSMFDYECQGPAEDIAGSKVRGKRRQRRLQPDALRACVITKLGKELGIEMFSQAVHMALATQARQPRANEDDMAAGSAVFPDGSDEAQLKENKDWSSDRVFLRAPEGSPSQTSSVATSSNAAPKPEAAPQRKSK